MTKRVIAIALALTALFALLICLGQAASAQGPVLPPKAEGERYMIFPPGTCAGLIEVGTWKKELSEQAGHDVFWAKRPRMFIEPCTILALPEFVAKYRTAARCVDRDDHDIRSSWIRSMSGEKKPFPELGPDPQGSFGCLGFAPGQPINPDLCPEGEEPAASADPLPEGFNVMEFDFGG